MWTRSLSMCLRGGSAVLRSQPRRPEFLRCFASESLRPSRSSENTSPVAEASETNSATTSQEKDYEVNQFEDNEDFDLDEISSRMYEALRKIDKDHIFTDSGFVRDPLNKIDISEMETGEETSSRPANQFRQILYDEGELDKSDLTKPPSPENPHPFDPDTLPPTHARSLASYVNHLPVLQRLIDLGMDLMEVEVTTNIGRHLVRLDWERDVKPKIFWLVKTVGVDAKELGSYLTRNPFFLLQSLDDLKARVKYLESKRFTKQAIAKIVITCRYWLNHDEKIIDGRLGYVQRQFGLRGAQIREIIMKEPRLTMFGVGPLQHLVLVINKELSFTHDQMRQMLINDPRIFLCEPKQITATYHYLTKVMQLSIEQIANEPLVLRCLIGDIRRRHEFLHRVGRAQYNEALPDHVPVANIIHPSDRYFSEKVAGVCLEDYYKFQKLS